VEKKYWGKKMIQIKDLDYSLSLKLGDPVQGNSDGNIFDSEDRLKYLDRAYSRLIRTLPKLMTSNTPLFANSFDLLEMELTDAEHKKGNGIILKKNDYSISFEKLEELFIVVAKVGAGEAKTGTYYNGGATFIQPDKYYSVLNGKNSSYAASVETKKFYYTYLSNKIYLLPILTSGHYYSKLSTTYKEDAPVLTWDTELPIMNQYVDLLIVMAANEGMQDLARQDKVGLYSNDIMGQLNILQGYAARKEQQEGSDLNG